MMKAIYYGSPYSDIWGKYALSCNWFYFDTKNRLHTFRLRRYCIYLHLYQLLKKKLLLIFKAFISRGSMIKQTFQVNRVIAERSRRSKKKAAMNQISCYKSDEVGDIVKRMLGDNNGQQQWTPKTRRVQKKRPRPDEEGG